MSETVAPKDMTSNMRPKGVNQAKESWLSGEGGCGAPVGTRSWPVAGRGGRQGGQRKPAWLWVASRAGTLWLPWADGEPPVGYGAGEGKTWVHLLRALTQWHCSQYCPKKAGFRAGGGEVEVSRCRAAGRGDSTAQGEQEQPLKLAGRPRRAGTACTSHSVSLSGQTGHEPLWISLLP